MSDHLEEVQRRRTFAIISHPDAGKTTLTEKFLHYGGAIQEAGTVRARKTGRFWNSTASSASSAKAPGNCTSSGAPS